MRERTRRIRWGEGGGEVNRDTEIRTCIYQACQKKTKHHGLVTTASRQFNLIRPEADESLSNFGYFEWSPPRRNRETAVEKERQSTEKTYSL